MVGLFTFLTIGAAVLVDLWNILDYKKGLSMVGRKIGSSSSFHEVKMYSPGTSLAPLFCASSGSYSPAFDRVPVILLDSLQSPQIFGYW